MRRSHLRVEPVERFVEQQQVARQHERAREQRGAQLSVRELTRPTLQQVLQSELPRNTAALVSAPRAWRRD